MSASDEFKNQLRQESLSTETITNALKTALTELIELKITTWVVPADDPTAQNDDPKPGQRMRTRINIVDGDIDNEIGSPFLSNGAYAELRDFHLGQVKESREILQKNLDTVQKLFRVLVGSLQQLSQSPMLKDATPPAALPASGETGDQGL